MIMIDHEADTGQNTPWFACELCVVKLIVLQRDVTELWLAICGHDDAFRITAASSFPHKRQVMQSFDISLDVGSRTNSSIAGRPCVLHFPV